jgi:hypothetical protein
MERARRMGRSRRATHTGRGIKIVSTKQDVGIGEEILECGPCFRCQFIRSLISGGNAIRSPLCGCYKASLQKKLEVEIQSSAKNVKFGVLTRRIKI